MSNPLNPRHDSGAAPPQHPRQPDVPAETPLSRASNDIPASPAQLLALQSTTPAPRPEKGPRQPSVKAQQVLDLIEALDLDAADDLDLATRLVRRLESDHDLVVEELRDDPAANHGQLVAWAVDADRLMRSRLLLESIDLS
jgi:hypothetical protein